MSIRMLAAMAGLGCIAISGCQSPAQRLDQEQQQAIDTALQRARFEMNCPEATGTVLSRKMIEPVSMRYGVERAEYTVGIEGCGKRTTMVVLCAEDQSGCFAGGDRR